MPIPLLPALGLGAGLGALGYGASKIKEGFDYAGHNEDVMTAIKQLSEEQGSREARMNILINGLNKSQEDFYDGKYMGDNNAVHTLKQMGATDQEIQEILKHIKTNQR